MRALVLQVNEGLFLVAFIFPTADVSLQEIEVGK
jgi:hypothetical protein